MRAQARAVVIGGGVVGCSVLYHLAKAGWRDVVLLERDELTSGSTWHAAGGMHTLNADPEMSLLQKYTIDLYRELERVSGQSCGIHLPGGLMLAGDRDRLDQLRTMVSRGRHLGLDVELVDMAEAARRMPLLDPSHFVGALWDPNEGHVDPAGVTRAYARAAQIMGAEIHRFTPVRELVPLASGEWEVVTDRGTIRCEHVVNAAGLWARDLALENGIRLPLLAMEHHYLVTEELPEVAGRSEELPHVIDFPAEIYLRQEGRGILLGTYEKEGVPWAERETPADFANELLPPDLDRIAPRLEQAFAHFPILARAGIRRVVNGPFTFTPDGNPLVGPVRGLRNYWCACGVMAGFSQGGGVGLALSRWMVEGDPGTDVSGIDVARFGDVATRAWTRAKVVQFYGRRFSITYPNEELPAGRPHRTSPIHDRLAALGAVFGESHGLEHALWFAPPGVEPVEIPSFRRSNAFAHVARECRAVVEAVGVFETTGFGRYLVEGPGAEAWLARMLAGAVPEPGRVTLNPMLAPSGRILGDFTLARLAPDRFWLFGSGPAEGVHLRWFEQHLPDSGVHLRSLRSELAGLALAGPRSRELLARLSGEDVSNAAFPFRGVREMELAGVPAVVVRLSFTGELGYEIWCAPDFQRKLFDAVREAGRDLGLRPFGSRALDSLRLEKGFGAFFREHTRDRTPFETGLDRFVKADKGGFIGREALLRLREIPPARRILLFAVEAEDADCCGNEPVLADGVPVGRVTSGSFGHTVGKSLALAFVEVAAVAAAETLEIEILGIPRRAELLRAPPRDPEGVRMRS